MTIEATYHSEVRFVRSSYSSKTGTTITLALPDSDELSKVQGMDGKRYMLALVEIGDDEQPVQKPQATERPKGGALAKLAGLWCAKPEFWAWASKASGKHIGSAESAAELIRLYCGVVSRAELDSNEAASALFQTYVRGPYMKHMLASGRVTTLEEVEA